MSFRFGKKTRTLIQSPGVFIRSCGGPLVMTALMASLFFIATLRASTLLDPQPENSSTLFGRSIADVGDVDCDDVPDLAVGAPFQDGDFAGVPGFGPPQNAAPQSGTATLIETNSFFASASSALTPTALTFTDVSTAAGFFGLNSSWCAAWGDYDNDGNLDVMTLGHNQANTGSISQLWHSNGDGTFTDVTTQAGLDPHNGDAHGAVWGDFDNDGLVDLFVSKGTIKNDAIDYNDLWHNNGNGTFTNINASAGVESLGHRNRGSCAVDYNYDSFLDIFVTSFERPSGGGENLLFHNNGDLTFTDVAAAAGLQRPDIQNRTACWADYDGDGLLDVFITQIDALYKNNGDGTFTDVTVAAGIIDASADVQAA